MNTTPFASKKVRYIAAAAALLLIAILAAVLISPSENGTVSQKTSLINAHYQVESGKTFFLYNGNLLEYSVYGRVAQKAEDQSGEIKLFIGDDTVLYAVIRDSVVRLAENTLETALSADGSTALYLDLNSDLYSVQLDTGTPVKIAGSVDWYMISDNGEIIFYRQTGDSVVTMRKSGKESRLPRGIRPLSISDKGNLIYAVQNETALVAYRVNSKKTVPISDTYRQVWLNADCTELLYSVGGKLYLCINGGKTHTIGNYTFVYPITPDGTEEVESYVGTMLACAETEASEYSVGYINKKHEMVLLMENVGTSYTLIRTPDEGETFYYIRDFVFLKAEKKNGYEPEVIADDVLNYTLIDNSFFYYVDTAKDLYSLKDSVKRKIGIKVYPRFMSLSPDGALYFLLGYDQYGELYMCPDGKKPQKIANYVVTVDCAPQHISYITKFEKTDNGEVTDVFVSHNGTDFTKILEKIIRY